MSAALSHRLEPFDSRHSDHRPQESITVPIYGKAATTAFQSGQSTMQVTTASLQTGPAMTSPVDSEGFLSLETHRCPHCEKEFGRVCDLNKHSKSHSRPFKCAYRDCKYWSLGWPTAKELERHENDKHSDAPRTFPCLFKNCPYRSKRESNCKQHMEKTHGWKYVRSKSTGRRASRRTGAPFNPNAATKGFHTTPHMFNTSSSPQLGNDFVLFPSTTDRSSVMSDDGEYDADGFLDNDDQASQDSEVVIPWTSPEARLRKRETFLEKFTQKFNTPPEGNELPIDPQLSSMDFFTPEATLFGRDGSVHSSLITNPATGRTNTSIRSPTVSSKLNALSSFAFRQRPGQYTTPAQRPMSSLAGPYSGFIHPDLRAISRPLPQFKRKEEDDEDDDRPQKRLKPTAQKPDFKDTQMPDIFKAAYPDIYNKNKKPLYASCDTEHKDISTLVRHLSRAPHKLAVSERCISSFDVEGTEFSHVKVGVCRRCWETYTDRNVFDRHILRECEKISKGKREKWQVLYDAFTPFADHGASPSGHNTLAVAGVSGPHLGAQANFHSAYDAASVDQDDSPASAPSPTTIELGPPEPRRFKINKDDVIKKLFQENQQLKSYIQAIPQQEGTLTHFGQTPAFPQAVQDIDDIAAAVLGIEPSNGLSFGDLAPQEADKPDRESLVGGMNSQPTVDAQGMMDDIQQTLSRSSSGMSSDRSTLRHVSNSPPQRFEPYNGETSSSVNQTGASLPLRHQPTSVPDSGYETDLKRRSLAAVELADQMKFAFPFQDGDAAAQDPVEHLAGMPGSSDDLALRQAHHQLGQYPQAMVMDSFLPPSDMPTDPHDHGGGGEDSAYYLSDEILEQWPLDQYGLSQPSSTS